MITLYSYRILKLLSLRVAINKLFQEILKVSETNIKPSVCITRTFSLKEN